MNLVTADYQSEADVIINIQQYLETIIPKIVGKPVLPSQRERIISLLV